MTNNGKKQAYANLILSIVATVLSVAFLIFLPFHWVYAAVFCLGLFVMTLSVIYLLGDKYDPS